MLEGLLPIHVENRLASIVICEDEDVNDSLCWGLVILAYFL